MQIEWILKLMISAETKKQKIKWNTIQCINQKFRSQGVFLSFFLSIYSFWILFQIRFVFFSVGSDNNKFNRKPLFVGNETNTQKKVLLFHFKWKLLLTLGNHTRNEKSIIVMYVYNIDVRPKDSMNKFISF